MEFHDHQVFGKALCTTVYIADSYSSWQKVRLKMQTNSFVSISQKELIFGM